MGKFYFFRILFLIALSCSAKAATVIHGTVVDAKTKEPLIGAIVSIKDTRVGASVSLSGSYHFTVTSPGVYTLRCSFGGYTTVEKEINVVENQNLTIDFELEEYIIGLEEVTVRGVLDKSTDEFALHTEKNSPSIVNVMSAKTIQLMPDITVANLLQRFSGVSVDRNSSGDAQYAIIRGMPQRYNYTLVNGIKIPSPDDKNRFVPMDLFPADLLDRLEVIKSLTPAMEGDATGGAMNLVMKDAPATFTVNASAATGTNAIAVQRGFSTFSGWDDKSPAQTHIPEYYAPPTDFTYRNSQFYNVAPINQVYNFSIGDRLTKDKKLGAILALSYQNLSRATNSIFIKSSNQASPGNTPTFDDIYDRQYSSHQKRLGAHLKLDYSFNDKNRLKLYGMFVGLDEIQHRHTIDTILSIGRLGFGSGDTHILERSKVQQQKIVNLTLQGDHFLSQIFRLNWSAVYSKASNSVPDWSEYEIQQGSSKTDAPHFYGLDKYWQTNYDQDYTGYLNLCYDKNIGSSKLEISTGGLYRNKWRDAKYYSYHLTPYQDKNFNYPTFRNGIDVIGPQYWIFDNGLGGDGSYINPNTYTAHEQITAGYIQAKLFSLQTWEIIGGVRAEHTHQDWLTPMPDTFEGKSGSKTYLDILPSLNVKYRLTPNDNLRGAYFRSINRPSLFEIVPYYIQGDYFPEAGNPYLQHSTIDNLDLRYEKFTRTLDQVSFGVFYKNIVNPIEQIWHPNGTSSNVIGPANPDHGAAQNFGAEIALTKYWGRFGVSGNYTYTHSQITTSKLYAGTATLDAVSQTRPLQGQSPHIANLSLLYKDVGHGLNLQLAMAYTGKRISLVSPYQNLDYWQDPYFLMDFSLEKTFLTHFSFYLKAQNLLNSPYQVYIYHANTYTKGSVHELPLQNYKNKILVQRDNYGQNFIAGFRYKFSK